MVKKHYLCNVISKNQLKQIRLLEQKKHRYAEGLFVAEGPKVVGDLLEVLTPTLLVHTSEWHPLHGLSEGGVCEEIVTGEELRRISFLQHPQQVLAVFPLPSTTPASPSALADDLRHHLSLALDDVQDPGNLGTIIRIADWYGIHDIYCSPQTADAWSPKVVQATMGSIARVRLHHTDLPRMVSALPSDIPVCGLLLDGDDIYRQSLPTHGLIVMGNEGNGISPALRALLTHRLLIPTFGDGRHAESLNVAIATAITCSEFRRRSY